MGFCDGKCKTPYAHAMNYVEHRDKFKSLQWQQVELSSGKIDQEKCAIWMDLANKIILDYVKRTNGSTAWRTLSTVGFNYYMADPEFGFVQAKSLASNLDSVLKDFSVHVEHEEGYFVSATIVGVNKGNFVRRLLEGRSNS